MATKCPDCVATGGGTFTQTASHRDLVCVYADARAGVATRTGSARAHGAAPLASTMLDVLGRIGSAYGA
jgi:hypothetical protein